MSNKEAGSQHRNALPAGYRIKEYQIKSILGHGGFGITYLAHDVNLDKQVAIKEYFPNDLAYRDGKTTVDAKSHSDEEAFKWGKESFLDEARTLAKFSHPNIVHISRYFEAHSTAYMVMDYEEGQTLSYCLNDLGRLPTEQELLDILLPLLAGLECVHAKGFLHRDIKPSNILIHDDDSPVLIDFGAARMALGQKSRSLTSVVTPHYAPFEQYHSHGNQGEWTDIYAIGAVLYRSITGSPPPESAARIKRDPMLAAVEAGKGRYSTAFLQAIDVALQPDEEDRPQNIAAFMKLLGITAVKITPQTVKEKPAAPLLVAETQESEQVIRSNSENIPSNPSNEPKPSNFGRLLGLAFIVCFILGFGIWLGASGNNNSSKNTASSTPSTTILKTVPVPSSPIAGEERVFAGIKMVFIPAGEFMMG
ncbi:MAG: serine/threonine-protein kinase, partial [Mariprofundales bacterium]